ncbi:MAG: diacylglycerol kinase family lipid kinase [Candidatus Riflebacteria bacterium]|nr:diacylglycerol kinase family lipid kinase [Candidatus Riflebacteria bacterium]
MASVQFIVNPNSGGGSARQLLERIRSALAERFSTLEVLVTGGPRDAVQMARKAAEAGVGLVVAVGGDGTLHEVLNGVMSATCAPPELALIPSGRGSDFARGLAIPADPEALIQVLAGPAVAVDVVRLTLGGRTRHYLNVADAGLGGYTVAAANRWRLPVGGLITYFLATAWALIVYTGSRMVLKWEGPGPEDQGRLEGRFLEVAVANGCYFGGGRHIAPGATPMDGLLDVVALDGIGRLRAFGYARPLYGGRITESPNAHWIRCRKITIESPEEVPMGVDGEPGCQLPATFEVVPGAVGFKAGVVSRQ